MTLDNPSAIDRQTLLASIPHEWEAKFKEELARVSPGKAAPTPILKLVALQVSQHLIEIYRQRVELALNAGDIGLRKLQSPHLNIKRSKNGTYTVTLRSSEALRKPTAAEEQVEHQQGEPSILADPPIGRALLQPEHSVQSMAASEAFEQEPAVPIDAKCLEITDFSDVLAQISVQRQRLGWTSEQAQEALSQRFGKTSQALLTDSELMEWLTWLRGQARSTG